MIKKSFFYFFLFLLLSFKPVQAIKSELRAEYNFLTTQHKVVLNFKLTNDEPTTYVTDYQIILPPDQISNLAILPQKEQIEQETEEQEGQNIYHLTFTNEVVGQGKSREFALEYYNAHLMQSKGHSKSITIPALESASTFTLYQTQVFLPSLLGQPDLIIPQPLKITPQGATTIYTFDQSQGEEIKFVYGTEQYFQFNYQTQLNNHKTTPAYQEVILPYQSHETELIYANLWPIPDDWRLIEHQWYGYYLLPAGESLNLYADGYLIYKQVASDFDLEEHYPTLSDEMQIWHIEEIPPEFLEASLSGKINITSKWHQIGFLPLPYRYQINFTNQTSKTWSQLHWQAQSDQNDIIIKNPDPTLTLLPWQTTKATIAIKNQSFWPLYQKSKLKIIIQNEAEQIIDENEQEIITFSFRSLALIAGVVATAITARSILVAWRKTKNSLRRQSQKSQK